MVCNRCILVVKQEFEKLGIPLSHIALGEVSLLKEPDQKEKGQIEQALLPLGFELIDDKKSRIIEKIKSLIIQQVHHQDQALRTNLSEMLGNALKHDYTYLSNLFSEVEGTTIEKYYIAQKIERVKELLLYDELSLSEIAYRMNYSSAAYLSNQFRKVTGLTPGYFRKMKEGKRKPLDQV